MRITLRYLKDALQKEFDQLEVEWKADEIFRTYLRQSEYESGAAHYIINIIPKNGDATIKTQVYVFYPLYYLQKELNNGYELFWQPKDDKYISESELNIRKKIKT